MGHPGYYTVCVRLHLVFTCLTLILLSACVQNEKESNDYNRRESQRLMSTDDTIAGTFLVTYLDTVAFDYYVIRLKSLDGREFVVLSKSQGKNDFRIPFDEYEQIAAGNRYSLSLIEYDVAPRLEIRMRALEMRGEQFSGYYIYNGRFDQSMDSATLFWQEDSILTRVYYSDDIYDQYIAINRR